MATSRRDCLERRLPAVPAAGMARQEFITQRDFLILVVGSTVAPLCARAQQPKTAKALGLTVPAILLAQADEVIE